MVASIREQSVWSFFMGCALSNAHANAILPGKLDLRCAIVVPKARRGRSDFGSTSFPMRIHRDCDPFCGKEDRQERELGAEEGRERTGRGPGKRRGRGEEADIGIVSRCDARGRPEAETVQPARARHLGPRGRAVPVRIATGDAAPFRWPCRRIERPRTGRIP